MSVANAGYSIGSIVGPLLVIVARPTNYPTLFSAVGVAALLLTVDAAGWSAPRMAQTGPQARHPRRRATLGIFVAAYILYVATESAAAGWIRPSCTASGTPKKAAPLLRQVSGSALRLVGFLPGLCTGTSVPGG